MSAERKVSVIREVITYTEMWHASWCLLKKGKEEREGSFYQFMASLVFTVFALEACLNHVGKKLFIGQELWNALERLSPKDKLNVVAEKLEIEINYGKRPWQVMKNLFGFRNDIAHGKTVIVEDTKVIPSSKVSYEVPDEFIEVGWKKYCNQKNAETAREDVEQIIRILYDRADFEDDHPFMGGYQETNTSID